MKKYILLLSLIKCSQTNLNSTLKDMPLEKAPFLKYLSVTLMG